MNIFGARFARFDRRPWRVAYICTLILLEQNVGFDIAVPIESIISYRFIK